MKNTRLKLFPPMLMLVAGSITSIMTYHFQYELKTALLVLLSVLLVFYIAGLLIIKVITSFDETNAKVRKAEEMERMAVLEKEGMEENVTTAGGNIKK